MKHPLSQNKVPLLMFGLILGIGLAAFHAASAFPELDSSDVIVCAAIVCIGGGAGFLGRMIGWLAKKSLAKSKARASSPALQARPHNGWRRVMRERDLAPVVVRSSNVWQWAGTITGVPIQVAIRLPQSIVQVRIPLSDTFPRDLSMHPARTWNHFQRLFTPSDPVFHEPRLDRALVVLGRDPQRRALLLGKPTTMSALQDLVQRNVEVSIESGTLLLRDRSLNPNQIARNIDQAVVIARALAGGRTVWDRLSAAHFLTLEERIGFRSLQGSVRGARVELQCMRNATEWHTTARVELPASMARLSLTKGHGDSGDLILDRFVQIEPPSAAARLLAHPHFDTARGVLIETVERWERVEVAHGTLILGVAGASQSPLQALLDAAVEVASVLQSLDAEPVGTPNATRNKARPPRSRRLPE
ncbi:MAG TPA: hypothetical protein DFR83_15480 [Deltaproteobacteria bacterium]|nr:hypothetical protein [Deltaproteobacteria bacterium]